MTDSAERYWKDMPAENETTAKAAPAEHGAPEASFEQAVRFDEAADFEQETAASEQGAPAEEAAWTEEPPTGQGSEEQPAAETARDEGWYRSGPDYAGERVSIYADAHYEPEGDTPTPPRYYTPPERTERPKREKPVRQRPKRFLSLGRVICLCLVCALLGGCLGAGISIWATNSRFEALEQAMEENARLSAENSEAISSAMTNVGGSQSSLATPVASGSGSLSPAQIYELACSQVVGITISYTTSSYFYGSQTGIISGSGIILSEDGYIVTNYHVVETAAESRLPITVVLYDGSEYEATIVGVEDVNDLAVLKIEASGLSAASFGNSDELQVGDEIYVVGNPLGELEFSMSTGHVSALDRVISTEEADAISMFQLDAAVNPGNSGGPVYNSRGQVVGIVTAKYSDTDVEGLGFAIPSNDSLRITEDLVTMGYVTGKAFMGIWTDENYNAMAARYYNMPLGAYVAKVAPDSAAGKIGLEAGDIITALDGHTVESSSELRTLLRQYSAGDSAEITFYRAGESRTARIVFDERTPESGTVTP